MEKQLNVVGVSFTLYGGEEEMEKLVLEGVECSGSGRLIGRLWLEDTAQV